MNASLNDLPLGKRLVSKTGRLFATTVLSAALTVTACSSDDDDNPGSGNDAPSDDVPANNVPVDGDSLFSTSTIAEERFANVTERNTDPAVTADTVAAVIEGLNGFSIDLHSRIVGEHPDENTIGSGYSIALAVSLLRAAAAGEVDSALANVTGVDDVAEGDLHLAMNRIALDLDSRSNDGLLLRSANRLFTHPEQNFTESFMDTATGEYGAPATEIDFQAHADEAITLINDWVSAQTNDLIPELLTELNPDTIAVIVNAMLLDALWETEFHERRNRSFESLDGSSAMVESFGGTQTLATMQDENLTAVEIPYKGYDVAMLVVQPEDIGAFEASLTAERIATLQDSMVHSKVDITMPKWNTTTRFDPLELLATSGFPQNPVVLDDLLEDDPAGTPYPLQAVHEAVIEVDETGTRAAAATAIGIGAAAAPGEEEEPKIIEINRPFLYFLIDKPSGLLLFSGRTVSLSGQ